MATGSAPSEIIERERKKLLEVLQQDLDSVLDSLTSRRLISEDEYETLEDITDPLKKSRKLLILVQQKGEVSCQHFLKCLFTTVPESETIWALNHEFLKHENIEPFQSMGMNKNSEDPFSPGEKQPENSEPAVPFIEKEHLDLETSETFLDKEISFRETTLSSRESEKEYHTPTVSLPHSVENVEYEVSEPIYYLQDGQRYDEVDDSLYLGEEEYLELSVYSEDAEGTEKEEDPSDPELLGCDGEEEPAYSETTDFSSEEQTYEGAETAVSLEEEEEESVEERKKVFKDVLSCLNMDRSRKLRPDSVKQFSSQRGCKWIPETPGDLVWNFLIKVQALDVTARDSVLRHNAVHEKSQGTLPITAENVEVRDAPTINPLDVLCASMLCADSSLQRQVLSSMHQCQFALPLLLPDAENNRSILMLGAMRGIVKEQSTGALGGTVEETEKFLTLMKMPVISFVRLGECSFSKSRLLNTLLSPAHPESLTVFLSRESPVSVPPRQISDGLVEMVWCFPNGQHPAENTHFSQEPVAVVNLRGDLKRFWTQFGFLMEVSSAVFFFTDCLGEKEWDLLMFLTEADIERCYFVLSPQARESEGSQIFQRILNLKPSQLLFWEEEGAGEKGRTVQSLRAALQEVMSSSLRHVSVEDMGSLARELGIQVDQDLENVEEIQFPARENLSGTVENEGLQRLSQPENSSKSSAELLVKQPGAGGKASPASQNAIPLPGVMPHLHNSCLFPVRSGGHFIHAPLGAPWVMGSHFGSGQKSKWFHPSPFHNSRVQSQGKSFEVQYLQPKRFSSGERFMKFSKPAWGHHVYGLIGRPLRPVYQRVQAWPQRPQTMGACERPPAVVSQAGPVGLQSTRPFGKPQPRQAHNWGAQPAEATGRLRRSTPHTVNPHSQACQPAGVKQKPIRLPFQQEIKLKTQSRSLNPTVRMGFHPMSNNRLLPSSPLNQPKPTQPQPSQAKSSSSKPTQPQPSQTKSSPSRPTQPQPSQAKSSPSRPTQPQPSQTKSSPSRPTQPQPCQTKSSPSRPIQPQPSQSRPPQPRSAQPRSSQTSHSQVKAFYSRAGPRRSGKH